MAESSYLRYPHVACDLITFTAEDDVWLASLSEAADGRGTRARRLTADHAPVLHPRLNPSATHVAWTSTRDGTRSLSRAAPREAYAVPVGGGPVRRLTYWGDRFASVRGWVSDNEVLVLSRTGQHSSMKTWAFAVPLSGPVRLENRIRVVTCGSSEYQAAREYSLIRPPRTGFRRIRSRSRWATVRRSPSGTRWAMPWCGLAVL